MEDVMDTSVQFQEIKAAVVHTKGAPFELETLLLDEPRASEVLVRIVATGICATDLHAREQHLPVSLPAVFGHEGAGVVERVGSAVTALKPGDHVVLSQQSDGHCPQCLKGHPAYCTNIVELNFSGARLDGTNTMRHPPGAHGGEEPRGHFFGQSSFATYALVTERNAAKVPEDLPLELLGPLGCGLGTGAGTVLNALKVGAGSRLAVFGTGPVGMAAVMAGRAAGATTIIAVDIVPSRLALAAELGATHVIDAREQEVRERIASIAGAGVDYVVETTGRPEMGALAAEVLAPMGAAALIATPRPGVRIPLDPAPLLLGGRSVQGVVQGDAVPQLFIPRLIQMYRAGLFPFDRLVRYYDFDQINQAVADFLGGSVIKPVLRMA
jgi:aryl-alcohol dehydrogenase